MRNAVVLLAVIAGLAASTGQDGSCAAAEEAKPSAVGSSVSPVPGRPVVSLAGDWRVQFVKDPAQPPGEKWEAKPARLPGITRFPGSKEGIEQNGVWFERKVSVPADWQGRRIVLRIGRSMYGTGVHVNGKKAGEIPGHGGELDVTHLATPGQEATVRLYAGRLGQSIESLDRVSKSAAAYNAQKDPGRNWLAAPTGVFGQAEEFCLESRPSDLHVRDVWYRTSVRGGVRIEPLVGLWAAAPRDGVICRVSVYERSGDKPVFTATFPLGRLSVGDSERTFVVPAGTLKLWGIREPNLYFGQAVLLDAGGKELDRSNPVRFGIREVWAQGRELCLNGQTVYPVPAFCGWTETDGLDDLVAAGVTMVQTGFPFWFRYFDSDYTPLADACDERGLLFIPPGMTHHELNLSDPEVLQDYTGWAEHYYARYANHPSIVIYGLGINSPGSFGDFSPTKMGRTSNLDWSIVQTTRSYLVSRRVDPTRLYYFHGGPRGGDAGSANFYPNHIPAQEVEDWPSEWAERGDRPFLTIEGLLTPMDVDYRKNASYLTEYLAILGGDEAYAAETPVYRAYSTYEQRRLEFWGYRLRAEFNSLCLPQRCAQLRRTGRAWRFYGVPFNQWYGGLGTPGWRKDQATDDWIRTGDALRSPSLAWIGGPEKDFSLRDHNFYAGETVEKTVVGLRDQSGSAIWDIHWELRDRASSKAVASGSLTQTMSAFSRMKGPFRFVAPNVKAMATLDLALDVKEKESGRPIATDSFPISIYPRAAVAAPKREAPFLVFDPEGETTAWLKSLGVLLEAWRPGAGRAEGVLVIGRRALRGLKSVPYAAEDIERGLRVVVFEQHCPDLGKIGFRHEDRCPRQVFVRQPDHPLAAGLTTEALRDWCGHASLISAGPFGDRVAVSSRLNHWGNRGTVASAIIETPHFGPFVPVLDCEFDLSYTPLLSWRHGKGEVLFCQLDLTGRIGREPAADTVARNLIQYFRSPLPERTEKTSACLDGAMAQAIEALGFDAKPLPPKAGRHILAIAGPQKDALAAQRESVVRFLKAGGELLVLYADGTLLAEGTNHNKEKLAMRKMQALAVAMGILGAAAGGYAAGGLTFDEALIPRLNIPKMSKPPTIDGTIDPAEWHEAAKVMGMVNTSSLDYKDRPASFWLAWDPQHLYLAYRVDILTEPKPYLRRAFRDKYATGAVYDDALEFGLFLHDLNKPQGQASSFYQCIVNYLGCGEYSKSYPSIGQNLKNWLPKFDIKSRIVTDAAGKSWWEMVIAMALKDLEMPRPFRAGDSVDIGLFADVKNPGWQWLDFPSASGHLVHYGFPRAVLTETEPYIQVEEISGLHDEKLNLKSVVCNPADRPAKVNAALRLEHGPRTVSAAGALKDPVAILDEKRSLDIPAKGSARFDAAKDFPGLLSADKGKGFLRFTVTPAGNELGRTVYNFACNWSGKDKSYLKPAKWEPFLPTRISFNPVNGRLWLAADVLDAPLPQGVKPAGATYRVSLGEKTLAEGKLPYLVNDWYDGLVELGEVKPGSYTVELALVDAAGKPLATAKGGFEKKDEAKEYADWWNNKIGNPEQLLKPFEALKVHEGKQSNTAIACTRRIYELGSLGLPVQIEANGGPVLAATTAITNPPWPLASRRSDRRSRTWSRRRWRSGTGWTGASPSTAAS